MKINTKLEEEFNLAPMTLSEAEEPASEVEPEELQITPENTTVNHYEEINKIDAALPKVEGLDATDAELDELADYATKAHKDLLDLAYNVESKYIGEVAGAAGTMLGHAITARTNKIKKKLDLIGLQIKKQVADARTKSVSGNDDPPVEGTGVVFDRNELLRHLMASNNSSKKQ